MINQRSLHLKTDANQCSELPVINETNNKALKFQNKSNPLKITGSQKDDPGTLKIEFNGEEIWLNSDRTVFIPAPKTLLMADLHLGKSTTFQSAGIPTPTLTDQETLNRMSLSVMKWNPDRLVILGDFLHSCHGATETLKKDLQQWRKSMPELEWVIIRGNHDRRVGDEYFQNFANWIVKEMEDAPWRFVHSPENVKKRSAADRDAQDGSAIETFTFCGHLHPGLKLRDSGNAAGGTIRLPAFAMNEHTLVLPAFGEFTGSSADACREYQRLFAVTPGRIFEINS